MNTRIGSFRLWQTVVGQNIYKVFISRHRKLSLQLHASNAPRLNEPLRQQSCLILLQVFILLQAVNNSTFNYDLNNKTDFQIFIAAKIKKAQEPSQKYQLPPD